MYKEISEVTSILVTLGVDVDELFDKAFSLNELGRVDEAEIIYREVIESRNNDENALHNLSLILENKGKIKEALELSNKAAALAPEDTVIVEYNQKLKVKAEKLFKDLQKQGDFLCTAPERWPQVDNYKRQLLSALTVIHGFESFAELSRLSGVGEQYIAGHWRKLVEMGMVIDLSNGQYRVNEYILPLVKQERSHAIVTKIIRAEPSVVFKPIFNSRQEYSIYNILIGLFPNHLVFPNMALQTIFQYERMKELLNTEEFRYLLMSQVDFCITSTANYLPVVAFEVDSRYHEVPDQLERDRKKDLIFQRGGVPLLRLRAFGQPGEQIMRQQIIAAVRELGQELTTTEAKAGTSINISLEIDFERFGLTAADNQNQRSTDQ